MDGTGIPRLRTTTVVALCVTELVSLGALIAPLAVGLSLKVATVRSGMPVESRLSWVETPGAIAALVANPVFGWLADRWLPRTRTRAIWLVPGAVAGSIALWFVAEAHTLTGVVIAWCCAQAAYNATYAGLYGTVADLTGPADRARISAWFSASATASIALAGLFGWLLLTGRAGFALDSPRFVVVGIGMVSIPVTLLTSLHLHRLQPVTRQQPQPPATSDAAATPSGYWWIWWQRFAAQTGYTFLTVYAVFFVVRRTGESAANAAPLVSAASAFASAAAVVAAAIAAPRLAGRIGPRAVLLGGLGLLASATLVLTVCTSAELFVAALIAAGIGLGLYTALDLAIAIAAVPPAAAGRYLGFFNIARTAPQSLVPLIGPALLAIGSGDLVGQDRSQNYFAYFAVGAAVTLAATALIGRVPLGAVESEPVSVQAGP